jgi:hypothetical protein
MTHKSLLSDFYGLSAADDEPEAPPPKDERRSLESEQFDAQVRAAATHADTDSQTGPRTMQCKANQG